MSLHRLARPGSTRAARLCRSRLVALNQPNRSLFNFFNWRKREPEKSEPTPLLSQDNLFHLFSKSPFPAVRARGEAVRSLAPCPICSEDHEDDLEHPKPVPKAVAFDCPDCGWPTHCSEEHWKMDKEHEKFCSRLREVNEDEHDLRSGRRLREFELPRTPDAVFLLGFTLAHFFH
jgi:mitochondrial splicing suppressor protein 51